MTRAESFNPSSITTRMISVDDAQRIVLDDVGPIGIESVPLDAALGRVLCEEIRATRDVPLSDNSAMDGYAVRAGEIAGASDEHPVEIRVEDDVPAGRIEPAPLAAGSVARIMTGGPVPPGADAVVPVEWTDGGSEKVAIHRAPEPGMNIRRRGEDMRDGDLVIRPGGVLGAGEVGVLASLQQTHVTVGRRPSVAILPTGSELVDLETPPKPGQVVNSNVHALAALVREAGGDARIHPVAADSLDETVAAIERGLEADVLMTTGGVSVGAYDWVKSALERLGGDTKFWKVAMKPGKPLVFSRVGTTVVFGLPGNPVSAFVAFLLFVGPAIRKMSGGTRDLFGPTVEARVPCDLRSVVDRREFQRVRVVARNGSLVAEPKRAQGSAIATSLVEANGLAIIAEGVDLVRAGETVRVLLFAPIHEA